MSPINARDADRRPAAHERRLNPSPPRSTRATSDHAKGGDIAAVVLFTIGYERLLPGALVAELEASRVRRLIDVRFRPQSRRPGMSKTGLGALLAEHGIAYEHRRSLGTPPDLRWFYKSNRVPEGRAAFEAHIERSAAPELDALARELATAPPTALMCLEADPECCHRRVLSDALHRREPRLRVVDL